MALKIAHTPAPRTAAALPNGALPNATFPNAALPNAALPNGALPNGAFPNGAWTARAADDASSSLIQAAAGVAHTFHGDARRAHRASGRGPKRVHIAWKSDVGGAVAAQVTASPDGATLYAATLGGNLVALDAVSGGKKWSVALGDRAYGAPTIANDGTIFVGSDKKALFAIRPTGAVLFTLELDGEADSSPLLMPDGSIVVAAGTRVYGVSARGDVNLAFFGEA